MRKCFHSTFAYWLLFDLQTNYPENKTKHREWFALSRMLHLNQFRDATDPRDRIFSLLEIGNRSNSGGEGSCELKADYSLGVEEVFTKFSRKMIEEDRHLGILKDCERVQRRPGLPSWVPDWEEERRTNPLSEVGGDGGEGRMYEINRGCMDADGPVVVEDDKGSTNKLRLYGHQIDSISSIYPLTTIYSWLRTPSEIYGTEWHSIMRALLYYLFINLPPPYKEALSIYKPTNEPIIIAFLRTLAVDNFPYSSKISEEEKAKMFPHHYSFLGHPEWLSVRMQVLRRMGLRGYEAPESSGIRLGSVEDATRHSRLPPRPFDKWPEWMRGIVMAVMRRIYRHDFIAPNETSTLSLPPSALTHLYTRMVQDTLSPWPSLLPYLPTNVHNFFVRLRRRLGIYRIARHRTDMLMEVTKYITRAIPGRVLIFTKKGHMGLGPVTARVGDGIFALRGADVGFVLREKGEGQNGEWELLGEAYVHGVMDGEVWKREIGREKGEGLPMTTMGRSSKNGKL